MLDQPAAHEPAQYSLHYRAQRTVRLGEPLRINAQELLEVLFNQPEERGLPRPPRPVHPRTDLHASPPPGGRDRRESRTTAPCAGGDRSVGVPSVKTGPSSARPTHCLGHAIDMDEQVWTYLVPGNTMKLPLGISAMRGSTSPAR
jgi:hypothetical protein